MKKHIFFAAVSVILVGCSQKDEAFCECLKANDKLNAETERIMQYDEVLVQDDSELKALRKAKDEVCEPYETMGGEELKKLQEACKQIGLHNLIHSFTEFIRGFFEDFRRMRRRNKTNLIATWSKIYPSVK